MLFLVTGGYVTIFGVHKLEQDEKPYTGVSTNGGTPKILKWKLYNGKSYIIKWIILGYPRFLGNQYIYIYIHV